MMSDEVDEVEIVYGKDEPVQIAPEITEYFLRVFTNIPKSVYKSSNGSVQQHIIIDQETRDSLVQSFLGVTTFVITGKDKQDQFVEKMFCFNGTAIMWEIEPWPRP